ncbi:hypothetical protein [Herbidospora sp. RD11066]
MSEDFSDVRRLMAPFDPAPPESFDGAADAPEARATLRRILATPPRRGLTRRSVLAVAGVAALASDAAAHTELRPAVTVGMLSYRRMEGGSPLPGGLPSARPALLELSRVAGRRPAEVRPAGARYDHIVTNTWGLNVAVSGGRTSTAVVPSVVEVWTPVSPPDLVRRVERPGRPIVIGYGDETTAAEVAAGNSPSDELLTGVTVSPSPEDLPLDPPSLRRALLTAAPRPESYLLVQAVIRLFSERYVPSRLAAALWRMLADERDLRLLGETTDRAGRKGWAFALDVPLRLPRRLVMIIDPDSGRLISSEEILTEDAGKLNVAIPAVIGYTLFLGRSRVPSAR